MAEAREELRRGKHELDRNARDLKSHGVDVEEIKADLARSLAEVMGAARSIDEVEAKLNRTERR